MLLFSFLGLVLFIWDGFFWYIFGFVNLSCFFLEVLLLGSLEFMLREGWLIGFF